VAKLIQRHLPNNTPAPTLETQVSLWQDNAQDELLLSSGRGGVFPVSAAPSPLATTVTPAADPRFNLTPLPHIVSFAGSSSLRIMTPRPRDRRTAKR